MMKTALAAISFFAGFVLTCSASRVIELSDRFLELRGQSSWLIMFYAPWCGHCKKMEPVWNHVAQTLYHSDVRVGRVDCTRFVAMATEFKIKGFPTILFLKGDIQHVYRGDRTEEEIVGFAQRMSSAHVPHLEDFGALKHTISERKLFFLYAGEKDGTLWEAYYDNALEFRHFHFFFSTSLRSLKKLEGSSDSAPSVMVFKDNSHYPFMVSESVQGNLSALNESLGQWINHERFPSFMKFTHGNLAQVWKLEKFLAMVVIEESKIGTFEPKEQEFRDLAQSVLEANLDKYRPYFQFGWTGTPDLANSIAMERLSLPSFLVLNVTSMHHYFPEEDATQFTAESLALFLDSILNESAPPLGGDSYALRLYRNYYNAKTSLEDMWAGNPVLTAVLFGLPLGFLSLICYSIWCSDILDADDEERDEHEKKD